MKKDWHLKVKRITSFRLWFELRDYETVIITPELKAQIFARLGIKAPHTFYDAINELIELGLIKRVGMATYEVKK